MPTSDIVTSGSPLTSFFRLPVVRRVLLSLTSVGAFALVTFGLPSFVVAWIPAAERTLSIKLPIEGARFHWTFLEPEAFLAGELTLRIINDDRDTTIVIVKDGTIADGWTPLDDRPDGALYFGFATDQRVLTQADDSLVITLTAPSDLRGRGPYREGTLPAGTWQMTGTYSSMFGGRWNPFDLVALWGDPPVAHLECWRDTWPITVTKDEGGKREASEERDGILRVILGTKRGTNGDRCGSHN